MEHPDYNSPASLKSFLETNGMAMQKKFGQNFMINPDSRKKIAEKLQLEQDMPVWEIGPGLGCITEELLQRNAEVTIFEIDHGFVSFLHQFFSSYEENHHLTIIEGDVLKTWRKEYDSLTSQNLTVKRLVGNLPYNIAATVIADTITNNVIFDKCAFTVQKEVADRMTATPGTEDYSSFSVLCQWAYDVHSFLTLAPGNFWPRPNVNSSAVLFEKKMNPLPCTNKALFVKLVHALFSSRRKTINNNIKMILPATIAADSIFSKARIAPSERAEDLSIEQLVLLSETVSSAILEDKA